MNDDAFKSKPARRFYEYFDRVAPGPA